MTGDERVDAAARRVEALEAELESSVDATTGGDELTYARRALATWVETVVGVAASPGTGRVTLIHANGTQSKIASPELPYLVSPPASFAVDH